MSEDAFAHAEQTKAGVRDIDVHAHAIVADHQAQQFTLRRLPGAQEQSHAAGLGMAGDVAQALLDDAIQGHPELLPFAYQVVRKRGTPLDFRMLQPPALEQAGQRLGNSGRSQASFVCSCSGPTPSIRSSIGLPSHCPEPRSAV